LKAKLAKEEAEKVATALENAHSESPAKENAHIATITYSAAAFSSSMRFFSAALYVF